MTADDGNLEMHDIGINRCNVCTGMLSDYCIITVDCMVHAGPHNSRQSMRLR